MKNYLAAFLIIVSILFSSGTPLSGIPSQLSEDDDYPIYIVQAGDSLASIALEFGVDLDELIAINNIENPNTLSVGMQLILPGLEGISGILTTIDVGIGETLKSLSVRSGVDSAVLMKINKLSSPVELYYNANIIIPQTEDEETAQLVPVAISNNATTLLEQAVKADTTEWEISNTNGLSNTWSFLPNQMIYQISTADNASVLFPGVQDLTISPDEIFQGDVVTVDVETTDGYTPKAFWNDRELPFYSLDANQYEALQGINAMHDVGLDRLQFQVYAGEQEVYRFEQYVITYETYYPSETIIVDPATIDPATQAAEDELIESVISQITEEKYWNAPFLCVVDQPVCIRSWYGTNRSYNDGMYYNFHSGLDYGVCATLNIYAPADGKVVFTDSLVIRGNATYIDHGYGVYSAFFHQSEIWVNEGDYVKAGDIIGQIGTTGRSTGAHLHYDFIVNGEQVNPLNFLPIDCQ